jgi:GNAT superfamily N-acetyltransferase
MNDIRDIHVDDTTLVVRPIDLYDVERLGRLFNRLTPSSIYQRFFSPIRQPSRNALLWLTNVDHERREALVALDGDEIVAVARYDGRPGSAEAEVAVTVDDAWQHRGVGKRLTRRLAAEALDHGYDHFVANMLPGNRAALGLLRKFSREASVRFEDGAYTASVPLARAG